MTEFTIWRRDEILGTVEADCYLHAARKWARKQHGKRATALLVQGDPDKSGCYQAYESYGDGLTSVGENFCVR